MGSLCTDFITRSEATAALPKSSGNAKVNRFRTPQTEQKDVPKDTLNMKPTTEILTLYA